MSEFRNWLHSQVDLILDSGEEGVYEKALLVALLSHAGQKDKSGATYIRHPIRVAEAVKGTEKDKSAALLHDTLEDTKTTSENLREVGFSTSTIQVVQDLTKDPSLSYLDNIIRVLRSSMEITRSIKIADLLDNIKLSRLKNRYKLTEKDLERLQNYIDALNILGYRD